MTSPDLLAFSICRLQAPGLELGHPDRFSLSQDLVGDAQALQTSPRPAPGAGSSSSLFASRIQADGGGGGGGGSGLLKLPTAFGSVYLGQAFTAIVAACNLSGAPLGMVGIKVELSSERSRVALLYDSTPQPLPQLGPGQRHDLSVRQDIKDLGAHSLTCTATYLTPEGERRQQVQAFSFSAANPLVVRTKQRHVGEAVLLEATLENATRDPMLLDTVSFLPAAPYSAERIGGGGAGGGGDGGGAAGLGVQQVAGGGGEEGPLSSYIQALPLIPVSGSLAFLFRLTKPPPSPSPGAGGPAPAAAAPASTAAASAALGKIEIRWRGPMGQMARLQTQLISLPPQQGPRELTLGLARLPARVAVGRPFSATLKVTSSCDHAIGPLKVTPAAAAQQGAAAASPPASQRSRRLSGGGEPAGSGSISREGSVQGAAAAAGGSPPLVRRSASSSSGGQGPLPGSPRALLAAAAASAVCLDGPQEVVLGEVGPRQAAEVSVRLLALAAGQQALPALVLVGAVDGRQHALLPPVELFVDSA